MKRSLFFMMFGLIVFMNLSSVRATTLDGITSWTGTGANRAALVIHWSSPEVFNGTSVPAPVADQVMVWGYRFDGTNVTGMDMFRDILAADDRLYSTMSYHNLYGWSVLGVGYDSDGDGNFGVTDGTTVFGSGDFVNGVLNNPAYDSDSFGSLDPQDVFWGGHFGPNWETWREQGSNGGFTSQPDRGSAPYWTLNPNDPYYSSGTHGQWELSWLGNTITNGSWVGLTVAAGGWNYFDDTDPGTIAYYNHKHAPVPEPTSVLLVLGGLMSINGWMRREER